MSSATATATPTPSKTPPPLSCLKRPGGCAEVTVAAEWPLTANGGALAAPGGAPPPALFASWPFLSAAATITLPLTPANVEVVTVVCAAVPAPLAVAAAPGAPPPAPCPAPPAQPGAFCGVVPSLPAGAAGNGDPYLLKLVVSLPGGGALSAAGRVALDCEVRSGTAPGASVPDARFLPRYGSLTALGLLPITVLPAAQPRLAAVVVESRAVAGTFRVTAGVGAGALLPIVPPPSAAWNATATAPSSWDSPFLGAPSGAPFLAPLLAALSRFQAPSAVAAAPPAALSLTLSAVAHLLLLLPADAPLEDAPLLNVSLNSLRCRVNWVGGNGTVVSVTTPSLASLCGGAPATDCGTAVLSLRRGGGDPLEDAVGVLARAAAAAVGAGGRPSRRGAVAGSGSGGGGGGFFFPAAYPPLALPAPMSSPAFVGLSFADVLAFGASSVVSGTGVRLAVACSDSYYARADECTLVGGRAPPPPPAGSVCPYGSGADCSPCPADKALCPGGATLLLLPGWWAPLPTSPPSDVVRCPPPAEERCPGWVARGAAAGRAGGLCGSGFTGAGCGSCARGFFRERGSCAACPSLDSRLNFLVLPASFVAALVGLGVVLFIIARHTLMRAAGGRAPPCCDAEGGSVTVVAKLLLWVWVAAQTLSALFSQAVADGNVPPSLVNAFDAFSALQFQGVTLAPACVPDDDPFAALWTATGWAFGAVAVGAACVGALVAGRRAAERADAPPLLLYAARYLLLGIVSFFFLGYGGLVSTAVGALACTAPKALAVVDYLSTRGDGSAVREARGAAAPNMTVLRAAANDPFFAQRAGLAPLLASTVTVPLLALDPNIVCGEGAHVRAREAALALMALLAAGLPLLVLASLYGAGKLKCLQGRCAGAAPAPALAPAPAPEPFPFGTPLPAPRRLTFGAARHADKKLPPALSLPPPLRATPASIVLDAVWRSELLPRAQWLPAYTWALTALCTIATAYAGTATSQGVYLAYQVTMALALLGSALLLWWMAPNVPVASWKNWVQVFLFILAGAAACVNVALRYFLAPRGTGALICCAALLAGAAVIFLLLLVFWVRTLSELGARRALTARQPPREAGGALGRGGGRGVVREGAEEAVARRWAGGRRQGPLVDAPIFLSATIRANALQFTRNPLLNARALAWATRAAARVGDWEDAAEEKERRHVGRMDRFTVADGGGAAEEDSLFRPTETR